MLLTINIPTRNYQVGTDTIPDTAVPPGATELVITFGVTDWTNPASQLRMVMEASLDGGATWVGAGASTTACGADGTFRDRQGAVVTSIFSKFGWSSLVTHLRGTITISGANIRTGGTVEVN